MAQPAAESSPPAGQQSKGGPDGKWEPREAASTPSAPSVQSNDRERAAPGVASMSARNRGIGIVLWMGGIAGLLSLLLLIAHRRDLPWKTWVGLLVFFVAAFALRWLWPSHTVFHENHHGFDYLRSIQQGFGQTYGFTSSYIVLMKPLSSLFPVVDDGVFFWNAVFSALQVPVLILFTRLCKQSWTVSWLAGLLWMLTPHAIRLAPTETYFNWITLLLLLVPCVAAIALREVAAWERPGRAWLWGILALLLLFLQAKSRVLTILHPFAMGLFVLAMGSGKTPREKVTLLGATLLTGAVLLEQVLQILGVAQYAQQGASLVSPEHILKYGGDFVFLNASVVSSLWIPCVLLGVGTLGYTSLRKRRLEPGFLILGFLVVLAIAGSVHGTFPSRVRFELPAHAVGTAIAAAGLGWVIETLGHRLRKIAFLRRFPFRIALVSCIGLFPLLASSFVTLPMHEQIEYPFVRNSVLPHLQNLPAGTSVSVPDAPAPTGTIPLEWWEHHAPDLNWQRAAPSSGGYLYIGLECFWTAPGWKKGFPYNRPFPDNIQTTNGTLQVHPVCAEAAVGQTWEPVLLESAGRAIPNPCVDIKPSLERVTFGLFRSSAVP